MSESIANDKICGASFVHIDFTTTAYAHDVHTNELRCNLIICSLFFFFLATQNGRQSIIIILLSWLKWYGSTINHIYVRRLEYILNTKKLINENLWIKSIVNEYIIFE